MHYVLLVCLDLSVMSMLGASGGYKYSTVPGFPFTRLPCDSSASGFQRIDLDRYLWFLSDFLTD